MKILITGGAGFIGSQLAQTFIKEGHSVVVVDDLSHGDASRLPAHVPLYRLDIRDWSGLRAVIRQEKPEAISHQAALVSVRDSVRLPDLFFAVNTEGTRNVFELAREFGVRKLIFASSGGAVYGEAVSLPVNEEADCKPISPYGESKRLAEEILGTKNSEMEKVVLRYGNVYGPGQDPLHNNSVISIFTHQLVQGERPVIFGDGTHVRDYVYIEDVVQANVLALSPGITGVYNIGTGTGASLVEIYSELTRLLKCDVRPEMRPAYPFEVRQNILDVLHARKALKWQANTPLHTGIAITVKSVLEKLDGEIPGRADNPQLTGSAL